MPPLAREGSARWHGATHKQSVKYGEGGCERPVRFRPGALVTGE